MKNLLGIRASVGATLIEPSNGDRTELPNSLRVLVGDFCERARPRSCALTILPPLALVNY